MKGKVKEKMRVFSVDFSSKLGEKTKEKALKKWEKIMKKRTKNDKRDLKKTNETLVRSLIFVLKSTKLMIGP